MWILMLSKTNVKKYHTFAESILRLVYAARKARIISRFNKYDIKLKTTSNSPTQNKSPDQPKPTKPKYETKTTKTTKTDHSRTRSSSLP